MKTAGFWKNGLVPRPRGRDRPRPLRRLRPASRAWSARPTTSACGPPSRAAPTASRSSRSTTQSIANIGRWPWSRDVHAKMTELLAGAKAKVIGNTVFFSEPQVDPGSRTSTSCTTYRKAVARAATRSSRARRSRASSASSSPEAESALNTDRKLAASYEQGRQRAAADAVRARRAARQARQAAARVRR